MIVCTMPGCQTTTGCRCSTRAGVADWLGQIKRDAMIPDIANPVFAAGRLAGLREAAALHECAADELKGARTEEQRKRRWHQNSGAAILALAEGKKG